MANDKLNRLIRYVDHCKARLTSPPNEKHTQRAHVLYAWLEREIKMHQVKIDALKLSEPVKK